MDLPPPCLKALSPAHRNSLAPTPPPLEHLPASSVHPWHWSDLSSWHQGPGHQMVPADGLLCLAFRYPLSTTLCPLPLLLWGLAEGRADTSHPLGTVPRPQDFRGSWPWGAAGRMERGEGKGNRDSEEERVAGEHRREAAGWPGVDIKRLYLRALVCEVSR